VCGAAGALGGNRRRRYTAKQALSEIRAEPANGPFLGPLHPEARMRTRLFLAGTSLMFAMLAQAADWPQFRGPNRDGVAQEKGLLKKWPDKGPKLAWSFDKAGLGFSSMAVADGKLYTLGTRDTDEIVLCLDAANGKELWIAKIAPIFTFKGNLWGDGPRGTPTIEGGRLYAIGGQGELVCLDVTGAAPKEVWRKSLLKDLDGEVMDSGGSWGYCESPLIDGKLLICTPGGKKGTLAALDKMTGAVVWRSTELKHAATYASAVAADVNGVHQCIQTSFAGDTEGGFLNGFDATNGKLLWTHRIVPGAIFYIAATPIVKDNSVYYTTYESCHLFDAAAPSKSKDLYTKAGQKGMKNHHGGVVLVGDYVYGRSQRGWACQSFKDGKLKWEAEDIAGQKSGSVIAADGMLFLYSDNGEVGLAEANPKEFMLAGSFKLPQLSKYPRTRPTSHDSGVWSHPAIANGRLYLRDCEFIYCYEIK
jgi:outer membrane protein assembly factor BamB